MQFLSSASRDAMEPLPEAVVEAPILSTPSKGDMMR